MLKTACGNGFPLNIPSEIPTGGGSGGTSDYSELSNKPSINSVTLSGNKTAEDLGLASADIEDLIPADASSSNQLATAADLPGLATTSAAGLVQPDGTSITINNGVISANGSGDVYSTTEILIGTWNNAPLYRKIVEISAFPGAGKTIEVPLGVSNVTYRKFEGCVQGLTALYNLPMFWNTSDNIGASININTNVLTLRSISDYSTASGYVIIYYTKNS